MLNALILTVALMGQVINTDVQKHIEGMGSPSFVTRERHNRELRELLAEATSDEELIPLWDQIVDGFNKHSDPEVRGRCRRLLQFCDDRFDIADCSIWSLKESRRVKGGKDIAEEYFRKAWRKTHGGTPSTFADTETSKLAFAMYIEDLIKNKKRLEAMQVSEEARSASEIIGKYGWATWFNTRFPPPGIDRLVFHKLRGVVIIDQNERLHLTSPENIDRLAEIARNLVPPAPKDDDGQPNIDDVDTRPRPPAPPAPEPEDEEEE